MLPSDHGRDRVEHAREIGPIGAVDHRADRRVQPVAERGGSEPVVRHQNRPDGFGQSLHLELAVIVERDSLGRAGEVHDALARKRLAGLGLAAQPGREIQRPAAVPALDGYRLTRVDPDPNPEGKRRVQGHFVREYELGIDGGPKGLPGRDEYRQGLIAAKLDDLSAPGFDGLAHDLGKLRRKPRGGLVSP